MNKREHKEVHDRAVSRVVMACSSPVITDFTVKELTSMAKYIGLTPTRSCGKSRPSKKDRFKCWIQHYKDNKSYRETCFRMNRVITIGTHVAKYFKSSKGKKLFEGHVTHKFRDARGRVLWHVMYYDGDEEDLNNEEALDALKEFQHSFQKWNKKRNK